MAGILGVNRGSIEPPNLLNLLQEMNPSDIWPMPLFSRNQQALRPI